MNDKEPDSLSEWMIFLEPEMLEHRDLDMLAAALLSFTISRKDHDKGRNQKLLAYITTQFDSFASLLCAKESDWKKAPETASKIAMLLLLLREASLRYNRAHLLNEENPLEDEKHLLDYLIAQMGRESIEQFRILFFDKKKRLILDELQSKGTVNHTPVYPREVAQRCLELKAKYVILVHNHPSGDATASEEDVITTQRVEMALSLFHIEVIDHYIITRSGQSSLRRAGLFTPRPNNKTSD